MSIDYYDARAEAQDDLIVGLELDYSHGNFDEEFETDAGCHYFRTADFIVRTNRHGHTELMRCSSIAAAEREFAEMHRTACGP